MSTSFEIKRSRILQQLEVPESEYNDLSPKGSIDEGIRVLIEKINAIATLVTTSSCAGRVSVYLEGQRKTEMPQAETAVPGIAGPGGKGGGEWLYVNHDPVSASIFNGDGQSLHSLYGLQSGTHEQAHRLSTRFVHFKFEAMILHILTASIEDAGRVLAAASMAGFRETGAMGFHPAKDGAITPMVAIRSNGLALDSIVGYLDDQGEPRSLVSEQHLQLLTNIANERFETNTKRIQRFQESLFKLFSSPISTADPNSNAASWEDAESRKARKRSEGLAKQGIARAEKHDEQERDDFDTLDLLAE